MQPVAAKIHAKPLELEAAAAEVLEPERRVAAEVRDLGVLRRRLGKPRSRSDFVGGSHPLGLRTRIAKDPDARSPPGASAPSRRLLAEDSGGLQIDRRFFAGLAVGFDLV